MLIRENQGGSGGEAHAGKQLRGATSQTTLDSDDALEAGLEILNSRVDSYLVRESQTLAWGGQSYIDEPLGEVPHRPNRGPLAEGGVNAGT